MLLQSSIPKIPLNFPNQNQTHVSFSNSISFSSGFLQNSTFYFGQPILSTTHKNPVSITCSSISQVHSYGTVDFEKRPMLNWNAIHKKISMMEDPNLGSASVLNQIENKGKNITKWELSRVIKELRKFKRYKFALQVYEWMNNREERYRVTSSDTAIQLDLIAKVHGISKAERYFLKLPDCLKDKRIYGSLLNAYVRARMKDKAEALMDKIRSKGYAVHPLPFNVMMTLYMNLKEYEKIELLVAELKEKRIKLDIYSYNIWLSNCGSQGSVERMEQVFEEMQMDPNINPNWTTFSTMATMYVKLNQIEKAEECLRKIEGRITGRDRLPFHYLISIYGTCGNKEAVYRVWDVYKASFPNIPNLGYHAVISSLVRLDEIEGAEKIYDDWLTVKTMYDPRVGNLLLGSYVRKRLSEKAQSFFNQMIEAGGKPNSMTWEILAEDHLKDRRIDKALSCLQKATLVDGWEMWKPKPTNVTLILKIAEQESDVASKDAMIEVLRQVKCLDDEVYMSYVPISGGGTATSSGPLVEDRDDIVAENELLSQPQESL